VLVFTPMRQRVHSAKVRVPGAPGSISVTDGFPPFAGRFTPFTWRSLPPILSSVQSTHPKNVMPAFAVTNDLSWTVSKTYQTSAEL